MQGQSKKGILFVLYRMRDEALQRLMLLIAVSLTLLCLSPTAIAAVTHEVNASWLNVRSAAALNAEKVGSLKRATQVEVVKRVGAKKTIQGKRGYWVKIKAKQASRTVSGYVFDAYLRQLPTNNSGNSGSANRGSRETEHTQPPHRHTDHSQSASQSHKKKVKQLIKQYPTHAKKRVLLVDVSEQRLYVFNRKAQLLKSYPVSTSAYGMSNRSNSNKTPIGAHQIKTKVGKNAKKFTIFKSLVNTGRLSRANSAGKALVTSRVLRLDGLEESNRNTYRRYIYIHGTNKEKYLGKPKSHGCIRMNNDEVIELFQETAKGSLVYLQK
ncbi:MAG: L,D-transpeptidase family protein [bacterium]